MRTHPGEHGGVAATFSPPSRDADGTQDLAIDANPVDSIGGGLAAVAAEQTSAGIYRAACALAMRLSGVSAAALFRQNERGLFRVVYARPAGIPAEIADAAASALHQRWIASHAPGSTLHSFGPFAVDRRPELLIVPLVSGDTLLGGMLIAGKRGRGVANAPGERIAVTALGTVTAQALAISALRQRQESIVSRAEHEAALYAMRKEIGRELHDGPTQDLALAGLTLDRLVHSLGADQAISADARQARDLIDRAALGMRKTIGKLRTPKTPAPSITGPLRELVAELQPGAPAMEIDFQQVSGVALAPEVERAMIGIVREALHNVRKHAQAESVRLEVRRIDDAVEIAVTDDGVGITDAAKAGHFGLEQIRELAEETGGRLDVGPANDDGAGTAVKAWIPIASAVARSYAAPAKTSGA